MHHIEPIEYVENVQLSAVHGGEQIATPIPRTTNMSTRSGPVRDQNTGRCGLGPWSFGQTKACERHDNCVGHWDQVVGRPASDVICSPLLLDAAKSAAQCAIDPFCPK